MKKKDVKKDVKTDPKGYNRYVVAMTQAIMLTTFVGILMILGYI